MRQSVVCRYSTKEVLEVIATEGVVLKETILLVMYTLGNQQQAHPAQRLSHPGVVGIITACALADSVSTTMPCCFPTVNITLSELLRGYHPSILCTLTPLGTVVPPRD